MRFEAHDWYSSLPRRVVLCCALLVMAMHASLSWSKTVKEPKESATVASNGVSVGVTPRWVDTVSPDYAPQDTSTPLYYALRERQVRLSTEGVSSFEHEVRVLRQASGMETGSQIQIDYDPSYQTVVIHQLVIWRDGKRIDKLNLKAFKILQRETQLERLVYDGRVTASLVLDDVRVNDRIEYAYTIKGQNPVFDGKFVTLDWGASSKAPIAYYRFRLLAPSQRHIHHQVKEGLFEVSTKTSGDQTEVIVQRHNSAIVALDPTASFASYLDDSLQWSEFEDWADVARWADKLFAKAINASDPVREQAAQLVSKAQTNDERVQRVLDFVQSDIRYFGTEIGANSHLPADAQTVLKQRYGDCKDKAALLVSLLRALGITAKPVLVSTVYREDAASLLPSPLVFDHAIAQVHLGSDVYWLDGTRSQQAGAELAYRNATGLGKVLLASDGESGLTSTPGNDEVLRAEGRDVFRFKKPSEAPLLETSLTYHGELAEMLRNALATRAVEEIQKEQMSNYTRMYPKLTVEVPLQVQDDRLHNALTFKTTYRTADYLRFPQQRALVGDFALSAIMDSLRISSQTPRTRPLQLWTQGIYRHEVDYEFEQDTFPGPSSSQYDEKNSFFDLHIEFGGTTKSYHLNGELFQRVNRIEAQDWERYKEALSKVWPHLVNVFFMSPVTMERAERAKSAIQTVSDDYRRGKSKLKSPQQLQSKVQTILIQAALDSDRLPPKLKAEALTELGVQMDLLGQFDEGKASFEQAQLLNPQSAAPHVGLAFNALGRFDFSGAERESSTALQMDANDNTARLVRAQAYFFQNKFPQARTELQDLLKSRTEKERSYGALWLYLTAQRLGEDGKAQIKPYMPSGSRPEWPYPVLQTLVGDLDVDKAERAATEGGKPDPGRQCELYYFLGMNQLLRGDKPAAKSYFNKSLDTGIVEFQEYGFSRHELAQMDH